MTDVKILEFATQLTEKAMGAGNASTYWIGKEEMVSQFLTTMVEKLNELSKKG